MIKLKKLINESNVWDRKFGEPLPTLSDVMGKTCCDNCARGEVCCSVNEDIKDVVKAKRSLEKIIKAEGKLRKHMMKIADTMEGHTVNIQLSKQLKSSYKSKVTSFMREVVGMVRKMK
jgi:hypothetical protein